MAKNLLHIGINDEEGQILNEYCDAVERTQSDIIREVILSREKENQENSRCCIMSNFVR